MSTVASGEPERPVVAERLRALLARRAHGVDPAALAIFARLLLARAAGYADALGDDDTAAFVAGAFRFFAAPGPELRVRAFTPTYASEGWDAPYSVIETVMPDRPFIVDTIRARLDARGVAIHAFLHPILAVRRDETGGAEEIGPPDAGLRRASFAHVAIARTSDADLARLVDEIRSALEDVRVVTDDFPPMLARVHAVAGELDAVARTGTGRADGGPVASFLRWLADGGFVFLGYREYGLTTVDGRTALRVRPGSGLGLLRREERSGFRDGYAVDTLPPWARARLSGERLLTVAKTLAEAPVHRRAHMDDVVVAELDAGGRVIGVRRFLGLFTSKARAEEAAEVPLLRDVLRDVLAAEEVVPGSHDHKEIVAIFNVLPKSELFASTPEPVRDEIRIVQTAARSGEVAVAVHGTSQSQCVWVLVALPGDRYATEAGERIEAMLAERVGGTLVERVVTLGERDQALLHFAFAPPPAVVPPAETLREAVIAILRGWEEKLREALVARHGAEGGARLAATWAAALPEGYRSVVPPERAAEDVAALDGVAGDRQVRVTLRNDDRAPATTQLTFYLPGDPLVLSEFMPVLDNLGLRALAEDQFVVTPVGGSHHSVQTFFVQDRAGRRLAPATVGPRLAEALLALHAGRTENDLLNRLIVEAGLDWRAAACLRTYCGYAAQIGLAARPIAIATLADHPDPARRLFGCFATRFRPEDGVDAAAARTAFLASLDAVQGLREDLLLRALVDVVEATVRTTFFVREPGRDAIGIKIRSADLTHLPPPRPLYEIYVHAPTVEGVHLRAGKVARGGIRASDRPEDFRTEVLGLMKTQTVKNAIIVPTGAKGGFVPKAQTRVVDAYATFIGTLLDLTDNRVGGRVVHPRELVIHDEEDPYLVVAADKGTASFSDVANRLAVERGFWLGDAFASGGSQGYDHKRLGITARGAWECVRTHFRELGVDADTAPLTVAGIGDMGGDVFGNGLLRSPHVRLRAAFNHVHVFLDPSPDPARSFAERERLFREGRGWDAYDPAVLSPGGAVLPRAAKRVVVSPEAQAMLGLPEPAMSGERLVRAILGLDVDLLWNGGIGTYVAGTAESDAEVRDPVNDRVRIRASALRARVVAEGGNLGFTQRARIEYALAGGRIDTDAIDNSAGVDLSDHEVNLKICLAGAGLTAEARNALLAEVTDDVTARVLGHNRAQSVALGLDQARSRRQVGDFRDLIAELEATAGLDRTLEALPDADTLRARRATLPGMTRPELAVLTAYTKIRVQHALLAAGVVDDPLFEPYLLGYFPPAVTARHREAVIAHALRRNIIATEVANTLVDALGATFVSRVVRDTGASVADVVRAWAIAWAVAGGPALSDAIARGGWTLEVEHACRLVLEETSERMTKWVLANTDPTRSAAEVARELAAPLGPLRDRFQDWLGGAEAESFHKLLAELEMAGLPAPLARELATADWLTGALDVVVVAREAGVAPERAAASYYGLGQHVDFAWLWARLAESGEDERWRRRAAEGLVEDLLQARRRLARQALDGRPPAPARLGAVSDLIRDLRAAPRASLAALQVVAREIRRLAETG